MAREVYDKSSFSFTPHKIQRMQTLQQLNVIAGESLQMDAGIVVRMSPLTRGLSLDVRADIATFFVPHRHVYGDAWETYLKQGVDGTTVLGRTALPDDQTKRYDCWGITPGDNRSIPKHCVVGYNRIFNRYYRHIGGPELADEYLPEVAELGTYGVLVTHLPDLASMTADDDTDAADRQFAAATKVDLVTMAQQKARYETELKRSYQAGRRYSELMQTMWGVEIGPETDERPHLVMHTSEWVSGSDVYGTGDANLGQIGGLGQGILRHGFPRRVFPEHGTLWTIATLRFPTIRERQLPLTVGEVLSYKLFAGDPTITAAEPPHELNSNQIFQNGPTAALGKTPYGQWHRWQPSYVHRKFDDVNGFPFVSTPPTTALAARYGVGTEWDEVFTNQALGHAQMHAHIGLTSWSPVPAPGSSIYAGTR